MFEGREQANAGTSARIADQQRNQTAMTGGGNGRLSIPAILDEQSQGLTGLHKMISELENRLAQVLAHEGPSAEPANRPDPPPPTQIADRLVMHNRGIDLAQQRIGQLIQRLHL